MKATAIKCFCIGVFLVCCNHADAQQLQAWSGMQPMQYSVNPAAVNLFDLYTDGSPLDVDISYRQQWLGYKDAPQTILLGAQYSDLYSNMTFGGFLVNDQFGPTDYTELQLQYAYRIHFDRGEDHFLSLGLAFSAMQLRVQESAFLPEVQGDPLLSMVDQSRIVPNVSLGIFYVRNMGSTFNGGTFLIGGLSGQQLIPAQVHFDGISENSGGLDRVAHLYGYMAVRHYYDQRGKDFVEPFISGRYASGAPVHYDLGVKLSGAGRRVFIGAGLSSTFQFNWQVGLGFLKNWRFTYSNGFFLGSALATDTAGLTHELVLSYRSLIGW